LVLMAPAVLLLACRHRSHAFVPDDAGTAQLAQVSAQPVPPQLLYLPDGGDQAIGNSFQAAPNAQAAIPSAALNPGRRCPPEMVDVRGQFCIDRWEATLVDAKSGRELSPYYSPISDRARKARDFWQNERANMGSAKARTLELPDLQDWQLNGHIEPMAVSKPGHVPNGYVDGNSAAKACDRAGKRLCLSEEWTTACRGEKARIFPYGDHYEQGVCNVFREAHPAVILHGDASIGHLDPRLNLVEGPEGPLLRTTGASTRCVSNWGQDAIYDMVGNLDEWVDDASGAFQGGFYARATRSGCEARITAHPKAYADYSLGVRCCK
jgi:formylglycine-generating enzyme required for sulfatase activity